MTDYCKNFGRLSNFFKSYASLRFFFQNPRCWVLFLPKLELFCVWKPRKAFLVVANILPLSLTGSSLANDLVISKKKSCLSDRLKRAARWCKLQIFKVMCSIISNLLLIRISFIQIRVMNETSTASYRNIQDAWLIYE